VLMMYSVEQHLSNSVVIELFCYNNSLT